jgi:hypothetical protein
MGQREGEGMEKETVASSTRANHIRTMLFILFVRNLFQYFKIVQGGSIGP